VSQQASLIDQSEFRLLLAHFDPSYDARHLDGIRAVPEVSVARNGAVAGTAVASVVGAVGASGSSALATFCCVGPGLYSVVGAGGALAAARFAPWRPWLIAASVLFLAVGFLVAYRRGAVVDGAACPVRPARWPRVTLWVAAVFTVVVTLVPELL
jgi:mercuric ion transport protein